MGAMVMAQQRTLAACQNGGHPFASLVEHPPADRIHPAVQANQPSNSDRVQDRVGGEP